MKVVGVDRRSNPCKVKRTCALRAVRSSPFSLTIETLETLTVSVDLTGSMPRALVLTHPCLPVSLFRPHILTPGLFNKGWRAGGDASGLTSRISRNTRRLTRRLARRLTSRLTSRCSDNLNISLIRGANATILISAFPTIDIRSVNKCCKNSARVIRVKGIHDVITNSSIKWHGKINNSRSSTGWKVHNRNRISLYI